MFDAVNAGWIVPEELQNLALGGDQDVVHELIALFKEDVAARLELLRQAVAEGDLCTVKAQAHTIKGSAIQMGAVHLVTTCRHLELDAANDVKENLDRLVRDAEEEFVAVCDAMGG
jgi:HPt (histidine-containing phosphotransfer) domain-containing protein